MIRWSIALPGRSTSPDAKLRTASVGKLLLLFETARRFTAGELDPAERLAKNEALLSPIPACGST